MSSLPSKSVALALGLVVTSLLASCGFSDTLSTRGFVKEGDQVCIDKLVKTGIGLRSRGLTGPEFLATLANAYGAAAGGFRRLDIPGRDESMRDRIVSGYQSGATGFLAASRASSPATASSQAAPVFADLAALQRQMRNYGFDVCGGGEAAPAKSAR
jgi:hypothetical protein